MKISTNPLHFHTGCPLALRRPLGRQLTIGKRHSTDRPLSALTTAGRNGTTTALMAAKIGHIQKQPGEPMPAN